MERGASQDRQRRPGTDLTLVVTAHRDRHLDEALASVAAQETDAFSLVLVADLAGDPAVRTRFADFARCWGRSRAVSIEVDGGSAGAVRNFGIGAADTAWVTYLDGDDVLAPHAMRVAAAAAAKAEADVYLSGIWHIGGDGQPVPVPASFTDRPSPHLYFHDPDIAGRCPHLFQLVVMRRSVWHEYPYYLGGPGGEDLDFILHHLVRHRVRRIPQALYGHRRTLDGFSERGRRARHPRSVCPCPCSQRYRDRYYEALWARRTPIAASNFTSGFVLSEFEDLC